eukprot:m.135740 g.135740  ORF g.135740 m.135740 type:complete len:318 (+) comp38165_c0_seq3:250-1203(+)
MWKSVRGWAGRCRKSSTLFSTGKIKWRLWIRFSLTTSRVELGTFFNAILLLSFLTQCQPKKVHAAVVKKWGVKDVIISGDFNAGGNYVRQKDFVEIDLFEEKKFHWLIDEDTTVRDTDCAYDRFVATGTTLLAAIQPDSVGVFNFPMEFGLTQEEAIKVSDHYPIELAVQVDPELELPQFHGKLVRKSGDSNVWLMNEYGHGQLIPDNECLKKLFHSTAKDVVTLPKSRSNIKEDDPISASATFAKLDDSDDIFFVSNCQKRLIANDEETRKRFKFKLDPSNIVSVSQPILENIPSGRNIQYPDQELRRFRKRKHEA